MNLLLDTHALLWLWHGDERLPFAVREAIDSDATSTVHISVATIWEIAIKVGKGKLTMDASLLADIRSGIALLAFKQLPIGREHAIEAGMLERLHGDPFDRMLIAQAKIEGLTLVSNEKLFDNYGVSRLWS